MDQDIKYTEYYSTSLLAASTFSKQVILMALSVQFEFYHTELLTYVLGLPCGYTLCVRHLFTGKTGVLKLQFCKEEVLFVPLKLSIGSSAHLR